MPQAVRTKPKIKIYFLKNESTDRTAYAKEMYPNRTIGNFTELIQGSKQKRITENSDRQKSITHLSTMIQNCQDGQVMRWNQVRQSNGFLITGFEPSLDDLVNDQQNQEQNQESPSLVTRTIQKRGEFSKKKLSNAAHAKKFRLSAKNVNSIESAYLNACLKTVQQDPTSLAHIVQKSWNDDLLRKTATMASHTIKSTIIERQSQLGASNQNEEVSRKGFTLSKNRTAETIEVKKNSKAIQQCDFFEFVNKSKQKKQKNSAMARALSGKKKKNAESAYIFAPKYSWSEVSEHRLAKIYSQNISQQREVNRERLKSIFGGIDNTADETAIKGIKTASFGKSRRTKFMSEARSRSNSTSNKTAENNGNRNSWWGNSGTTCYNSIRFKIAD